MHTAGLLEIKANDVALPTRRLSVADYYRMAEAGILTERDRVELIEVMESSAAYDRRAKAPLYARHGIPELWLFDPANRNIEVYRSASIDGYREMHPSGNDETLHPAALPDLEVALNRLLQ